MRATLSFTLPEEREEFELATKAGVYSSSVNNFLNWLRAELKYNDKLTQTEVDIYETIREKLHEFINRE